MTMIIMTLMIYFHFLSTGVLYHGNHYCLHYSATVEQDGSKEGEDEGGGGWGVVVMRGFWRWWWLLLVVYTSDDKTGRGILVV